MDSSSERKRYFQLATEKPSSLAPSQVLDSVNFVDAILARVEGAEPQSYARAQTLIALSAVHHVLQRPSAPVAPLVACHIPSVSQLALALLDGDPHVALAAAIALAAVSKALDVSGTRYGSELALALGALDARSQAEPYQGSAVNAITTLSAAGERCYARVGSSLLLSLRKRLLQPTDALLDAASGASSSRAAGAASASDSLPPLITTESLAPVTHEMTLCLLAALAGIASQPAAFNVLAEWADAAIISTVASHIRSLPRSLWGDRETGVSAWRRFESAIPGSTDDISALRVPTLFVPRYDTRALAAYSNWVNDVVPVRERELRQRAALVAASNDRITPGEQAEGNETDRVNPLPPTEVDDVGEPASFLAALQSSPELRDQALQRRDAALLALSFLSRIPALGVRFASCEGLLARLARVVETTVGITDAPTIAAAALARIAMAPGAAAATAAALGGHLQRLLLCATSNAAVQADVDRIAKAVQAVAPVA